MYDICCIGHIAADKVVTTTSFTYMPGGTAYYFSSALSQLDLNFLLVTSLAPADMHYVTNLRDKKIQVSVHSGAKTVHFENIYGENHDERIQNVLQKADPFTLKALQPVEAKMFHLGPLLAEDISVGLIKTLAAKGHISLDVQGFLRKVEGRKVYPAAWPEKQEALKYVTILKADVAELRVLTGCDTVTQGAMLAATWGVKEVVVTDGSKGSVIYSDGIFYTIPAYYPPTIIDATGCGDTYMAGYLYKRIKGEGIQEAGEFASAMAGLKTASSGPFIGDAIRCEQVLTANKNTIVCKKFIRTKYPD